MNEYPKIRWPLDVKREIVQNRDVLILRCPLGISPQVLFLQPVAADVLACFSGEHSKEDICNKFSQYGLTLEKLDSLIKLLDENLFLENENFLTAKRNYCQAYHQRNVRPPALAGLTYPAESSKLKKLVDEYLKFGKTYKGKKQLTALISPHIDYQRGGKGYGAGYAQLTKQKHDLYIVFGICHAYTQHAFILTRQDYQTPLGIQHCDKEFTDKLAQICGEQNVYADEILHATEHSIELQMPFITRLHPKVPIVPVLVGGYHFAMQANPSDPITGEYRKFIDALVFLIQEANMHGKKIGLLAGVDMSHVGQNFGDKEKLSEKTLEHVKKFDEVYLSLIREQNKDKLFQHIFEYNDPCHVCGFPAVYAILNIFERLRIKADIDLLHYEQAVSYLNDCCVTFASMAAYT